MATGSTEKQSEGSPDGQESNARWYKSLYQFDPTYPTEIGEQIRPFLGIEILPVAAKILDNDCTTYRILAVGSGTGGADKVLLQLFCDHLKNKKWPKIVYTVVEPDTEAVEICKASLTAVEGLDIEFRWETTTMEEFLTRNKERYDMVHFIYSLASAKWRKEVIPNLLKENIINKRGVFFTIFEDEEITFFPKIWWQNRDKLMQFQEGTGTIEDIQADFDMQSDSEEKLTMYAESKEADYLRKVAAEFGWKCKIMEESHKEDVTEVLLKSERGLDKLGYVLECRDICQKFSKEDLDGIFKQIEQEAKIEVVDGKEVKYGESLHHMIIFYQD